MKNNLSIALYPPSTSACMGWTPDKYQSPGLGGAEASAVLLTREFARRGHRVDIFNNTPSVRVYEGVCYLPRAGLAEELDHWARGDLRPPDVFIFYRAPDPRLVHYIRMYAPDCKIVGWSTDQATEGSYALWCRDMDYMVCISPFHTEYHIKHYGADPAKIGHIDLPVNVEDFAEFNTNPRGHNLLWASQGERGLNIVANCWQTIRERIPDATLTVTADRRLWGVDYKGSEKWERLLSDMPGITFLGAVPRPELVELHRTSSLLIGPLTYEELFCVTVAEAQAAGCIPITSSLGALPTTNFGGRRLKGDPSTVEFERDWTESVIEIALMPEDDGLMGWRKSVHKVALDRFAPAKIAARWEEVLEGI